MGKSGPINPLPLEKKTLWKNSVHYFGHWLFALLLTQQMFSTALVYYMFIGGTIYI